MHQALLLICKTIKFQNGLYDEILILLIPIHLLILHTSSAELEINILWRQV